MSELDRLRALLIRCAPNALRAHDNGARLPLEGWYEDAVGGQRSRIGERLDPVRESDWTKLLDENAHLKRIKAALEQSHDRLNTACLSYEAELAQLRKQSSPDYVISDCPHCDVSHTKTHAAPFCDGYCRACHSMSGGKQCGKGCVGHCR